jgi:hypothetical protein
MVDDYPARSTARRGLLLLLVMPDLALIIM